MFHEENGITFNDHVKEQTSVGMQAYRQEQQAEKDRRRQEIQERNAERDARREEAAAKKQAIRDERERKREVFYTLSFNSPGRTCLQLGTFSIFSIFLPRTLGGLNFYFRMNCSPIIAFFFN